MSILLAQKHMTIHDSDTSIESPVNESEPLRIAYLVNQYPKLSHSFIRREIRALESLGAHIVRIAIRAPKESCVNDADLEERSRTRVVLEMGWTRLLVTVLCTFAVHPITATYALSLAIAMGWKSDRSILRHLAYLAEACVMMQWLRDTKLKLIHVHFGTNAATVALLCKQLGGPPFSFTAHGPEEFDKPDALSLPRKIREAAFVIAISEFCRGQLCRWVEYEQWGKIHVVRCGLDRSEWSHTNEPVPAAKRLICVGRLCEQKGQPLLIEAAAKLAQQGVDFQLTIVGDGPLKHAIERQIEQLGLSKFVHLTGPLPEKKVRDHLLHSRALVLPSFAEGLPVVIMEAFALGRPVISTWVAGIPELVEPGVNGWLVSPSSVDALVQAMSQALTLSPKTLRDMGQQGATRVAQLHDIEQTARHLTDLFHEVARSGARRAVA